MEKVLHNKLIRLGIFIGLLSLTCCGEDPDPAYAGTYLGGGKFTGFFVDLDNDGNIIGSGDEFTGEFEAVTCNIAKTGSKEIILILNIANNLHRIVGRIDGNSIFIPNQSLDESKYNTISGIIEIQNNAIKMHLQVKEDFTVFYSYSVYDFILNKL